jgi:cell division protein FtsB
MNKSFIDIRRVAFYGIMLLLFLLLMSLSARVNELNQLTEQYQMMNTDVGALRATNAYLETEIAFAASDAAVDEYAREEGLMVKPGEVLMIPISPDNPTPEPEVKEVAAVEVVPNWRIWYQLFFADLN